MHLDGGPDLKYLTTHFQTEVIFVSTEPSNMILA